MYYLNPDWIQKRMLPLQDILNSIKVPFYVFREHLEIKGIGLLHSEANCGEQFFHFDYMKKAPDSCVFGSPDMSYSLIISLQNGTKMDLSIDGENVAETVELMAGDILFMCNNLYHRGCNYTSINHRLFLFLESSEYPAPDDSVAFY